jgi:hypothetical protein
MEQALTHANRSSSGSTLNRPPLAAESQGPRGSQSVQRTNVIPGHFKDADPIPGGFSPVAVKGDSAPRPGGASVSPSDPPISSPEQSSGPEELQDETPGRSPRSHASNLEATSRRPDLRESSPGGSDPLGEALVLLAGIGIALLTLVVPLLSVVTDRPHSAGQGLEASHSSDHRR